MLRPLKFLALPVALGVLLLMGTGCPPPPSYLPAYIVSTTSLDFGTKDESLKFKVWKNYTSQSLPEFSVLTGGVDWISVSPEFGNSTGPDNKQTITVTIDRSKMDAGVNTADLTISALGVADVKVTVTATASLVADFSAEPVLVNVNQNVQFTDESTVASEAGPIISWLWTFGDGKQSSAQNPKHKYKNPGTYPVTLTVQTATLSDTAVKQNFIVVEDAGAITADFVASDTTPSENTEVDFSDLSVPGNGTINEWFWNFGDGFTSTEQNPTHTYTSIDQFTVSLTVENTSGESDTEIKTNYIDVQPVGPTADFIADNRLPVAGSQVQFIDLSDPGSSPITNWFWNFGDGTSSIAQSPIHIYNAAGSYTVYLSVTTVVGSNAKTETNYIVVSPAP